MNGAATFLKNMQKSNRIFGRGGLLKVRLFQCYEVLWIHNNGSLLGRLSTVTSDQAELQIFGYSRPNSEAFWAYHYIFTLV